MEDPTHDAAWRVCSQALDRRVCHRRRRDGVKGELPDDVRRWLRPRRTTKNTRQRTVRLRRDRLIKAADMAPGQTACVDNTCTVDGSGDGGDGGDDEGGAAADRCDCERSAEWVMPLPARVESAAYEVKPCICERAGRISCWCDGSIQSTRTRPAFWRALLFESAAAFQRHVDAALARDDDVVLNTAVNWHALWDEDGRASTPLQTALRCSTPEGYAKTVALLKCTTLRVPVVWSVEGFMAVNEHECQAVPYQRRMALRDQLFSREVFVLVQSQARALHRLKVEAVAVEVSRHE